MRYKVEMKYLHGWGDACWTEETDAVLRSLRFETVQAAQTELNGYFADVKAAVALGDMDIADDPADYRIIEVSA